MNRNISNLTTGFVDLATYDNLEKHMYGGDDSISYFVRETRKSTWFTLVPSVLNRSAGVANFGNTIYAEISRSGDYLLNTWLRATLPAIRINTNSNSDYRVSWTPNVGHNLIKECELTFNELVAARFDNYHLDFWNSFTIPGSKNVGYNKMIGNVFELTSAETSHEAYTINVPLPFFFSRNHGIALPTAALPYCQMKIKIDLRDWSELITTSYRVQGTSDPEETVQYPSVVGNNNGDLIAEPRLSNINVWANYALVSNEERKKMACTPRDIVIEQVQSSGHIAFVPDMNPKNTFELFLNHSIKTLFFAVRNKTIASMWSNYTTTSGQLSGNSLTYEGVDPIGETSVSYVNSKRISNMSSDYYSFVQPFYYSDRIPETVGHHMYSYSLDLLSLDPMGSTNFGKLSNVSISPNASLQSITASKSSTSTHPTSSLAESLSDQHLIIDGVTGSYDINTNTITIENGDISNLKVGDQVQTISLTRIPIHTFVTNISEDLSEITLNNNVLQSVSNDTNLVFTPTVLVKNINNFNQPDQNKTKVFKVDSEIIQYSSRDTLSNRFFGVVRSNPVEHSINTTITQLSNNITNHNQKYDFFLTAINHNIARIAGGQLTFPVP